MNSAWCNPCDELDADPFLKPEHALEAVLDTDLTEEEIDALVIARVETTYLKPSQRDLKKWSPTYCNDFGKEFVPLSLIKGSPKTKGI